MCIATFPFPARGFYRSGNHPIYRVDRSLDGVFRFLYPFRYRKISLSIGRPPDDAVADSLSFQLLKALAGAFCRPMDIGSFDCLPIYFGASYALSLALCNSSDDPLACTRSEEHTS